MRNLTFMFRYPGLIESIAEKPQESRFTIDSEGYRDAGIFDLLIDLDPDDQQPFCFMSTNFDQTYPLVIWGLKAKLGQELFNVPQAQLYGVPLHVAFSWAYYHFILEDGKSLPKQTFTMRIDPQNITQLVLAHAVQTM